MKLELGGGTNPRGDGFVNLDIKKSADVVFDLEGCANGDWLPFHAGVVEELYSAHCLEHVRAIVPVLREIVRICKQGSKVEFRFPHWLHPFAMSPGHVHVISERQVRLWSDQPELYFHGCGSRLQLHAVEYTPEVDLPALQAKRCYKDWTEMELMQYVPGCCHEVRFYLTVQEYAA